MSDDLIKNDGPKVLAQIVISLVEIAPGQTGTKVEQQCDNEITALGLYAKAEQIIRAQWAQQAAPKIVPGGNGFASLPAALRRRINRG